MESIRSSCIAVWCPKCTTLDCKAVQQQILSIVEIPLPSSNIYSRDQRTGIVDIIVSIRTSRQTNIENDALCRETRR
ncbi:hypothetical protein F2P81_012903 [Scophthalmus maximus]|uniref:Uncharacterized protein n=1 Tax=Scophthalmus maximus TaxID=52904 RepID=A0A6A4SRG0_SCOMX|nr:hypothetical protein F2P81_012903 [Scophthalmus maximus]